MQSMIISLLALCAAHDVVTLTKVPVQFVTELDIVTAAKEVNHFNVRLCGGCLYDHQIATVFINQPNKPWSIPIGDYEKVYVTDSSGHQIATNKDVKTGYYNNTFSFPYYKTYGDLKLTAVTGNAPAGVTYTITLRFAKNTTIDHKPNCQPRYYSTDEEIMDWRSFEKAVQLEKNLDVQVGQTYELVSIFLTPSAGSVKTQQPILLQLDYCFIVASLPGKIVISVTATDEKSGFATYACPAHITSCSTETPFNDISGAAVNFVVANITQKEDVGPVQILIRGDGRYQEYNKFVLAASKYIH